MVRKTHFTLFMILLSALLITGCSGGEGSPKAAAIAYLVDEGSKDIVIDQDTIFAMDQGTIGVNHPVVLLFNATRENTGQERCLYIYDVERSFLSGWESSGGSGICRSLEADLITDPVTMNIDYTAGKRPTDPGVSTIFGLVMDERISQIQILWNDGVTEKIPVISGSYFAFREGENTVAKLSALDGAGEVLFTR